MSQQPRAYDLDPYTRREVFQAAAFSSFEQVLKVMEKDYANLEEEPDWRAVARVAYVNGFINGSIAATTNEDYKGTVSLMNDEIAYQKAWK